MHNSQRWNKSNHKIFKSAFTVPFVLASFVFLLFFGTTFPTFSLSEEPFPSEMDYDLIIKGGRIVDGTGNPWYRADIGIKNGCIQSIGNLKESKAAKVIDAAGRFVSPGFIDMMGGSSLALIRDPKSSLSKLYQGITTMHSGEGTSVAPRTESQSTRGIQIAGKLYTWKTFAEYFQILEEIKIPMNVIHNIGGAQIRLVVLGDQDLTITEGRMRQMKSLVEQAMQDGAIGLSTALIYPPGAFATFEEITTLAQVVADYQGIYLTHVRNESSGVLEAIEEAIRIGRTAGLPVHIFHLKAAGQENWPLMHKALERIKQARKSGLDITADIYPYIRNGLLLEAFIHPRHYVDGTQAFVATLDDPDIRRALQQELEKTSDWENWYRHVGQDWGNVLIDRVGSRSEPECVGESVLQVAKRRGIDTWQAFFDLIQERGVHVVPKSQDDDQKRQALLSPFVMIDTDASPTNPEKVASAHPRAFGAFPRILAKYVREEKLLDLEEAVRKMSSLPANRLQLVDRGRIAPGMAADILIFDLTNVQDKATFENPLEYAEGMDYVIINGIPVIEEGQPTQALPGQVLRHRQ